MFLLKQSKRRYARWFLLLAGLAVATVMTAASTPGPWHNEDDIPGHDCQCPVCKVAGHGLLESPAVIQPTAPFATPILIPTEHTPAEGKTLVQDGLARAPPG